ERPGAGTTLRVFSSLVHARSALISEHFNGAVFCLLRSARAVIDWCISSVLLILAQGEGGARQRYSRDCRLQHRLDAPGRPRAVYTLGRRYPGNSKGGPL